MDLRDLRDIDNLCCLALLFAGGGIVGWIYEMLFYRINDGMFVQRGQGPCAGGTTTRRSGTGGISTDISACDRSCCLPLREFF